MKKIILALVAVSSFAPAYALDFTLQKMKASGFSAEAAAVPAPAIAAPVKEETQVPQTLINRFNQAKSDLWRLDSDTTWLRSDIDNLERTARRMTQTNSADAFFQSDLRRMSWDLSRYNDASLRLRNEIRDLLNLAQKDAGLNRTAVDMERDARSLLNRAQFDIENSAQRLEWAVRGAKPELVGYNAQWEAMDISRYSREFTWRLRDLSYDAQNLVSKTRP